jgi:hypothetical protein
MMSMAICDFDRLLIAVHGAVAPTGVEWANWIELCRRRAGKELRALVESHGSGGPNAKQRRALADALRGQDNQAAILTNSVVERGVITAIAWLGVHVRAFTLDQHEQAAEHLGLSREERALAQGALPSLREACGLRLTG